MTHLQPKVSDQIRHQPPPTAIAKLEPRSLQREVRPERSFSTQRSARVADERGVQFDEATPFGALALAWLQEREEELHSGELALQTFRSYRRSVRGILLQYFESIPIAEITSAHVRELRKQTMEIPAAGNHAMAIMRRILLEAERLGVRPPNSDPVRRVRRHPEMATARPASPWAVRRVCSVCREIRENDLSVCHPTLTWMFELVALTGSRPSEMRGLQWKNVDFNAGEHGVLRLQRHKTVRKVGEKRIVLSPRARDVLLAQNPDHPRHSTWVFPSHRNPGHPYNDVSKAWRRMMDFAGLDEMQLRDLRTGLATNAYDVGVPLEQIQEMLTHSSIATTRRYTRISASRVGQAYAKVEEAVFSRVPELGYEVRRTKRREEGRRDPS